MIQRLSWAMVILSLAGCGMFGRGKNDMNNKENIKQGGGGIAIEIVDNVNSELWRLHPALHYMKSEVALAHLQGLNGDGDSVLRADAALFLQEMEGEYMSYEPSVSVIKSLDSVLRARHELMVGKPSRIDLLMIGGNWCSDTRMGLPRLCKVLDVLMLSTEGNVVRNREELEYAGVLIRLDYRRVNRDKKLIDGALAGDVFFGQKSVVIGRVPEVCVAHNWRFAQAMGGNPDVDFATETQYVGSIVEMPQVSWEADLLALFSKP
jgi:hypothetical protein